MKFNLSKLLLVFVVLFMVVMIGLSYYDAYRSIAPTSGEGTEQTTEAAIEI